MAPSLLKQLINFTSVTAGLEKTLRLIQAVALVVAEVSSDALTAKRCSIAWSQLALGRRYFRLLDFYTCFEQAYDCLFGNGPSQGTLWTLMQFAELSSLGIYCALENLTILHDMDIWLVPWYTPLLMEANKFWFYSICLSLLRSFVELVTWTAAPPKTQEKPVPVPQGSRGAIVQRMVVDACDLTLPGSFLGWIAVGDLEVGAAMVVSTLVASRGIWVRAQQG